MQNFYDSPEGWVDEDPPDSGIGDDPNPGFDC